MDLVVHQVVQLQDVHVPDGHLLVAKEKDPPALIEFGPPGATSAGLARGGALPPGSGWAIEDGEPISRYEDWILLAERLGRSVNEGGTGAHTNS